MSGRLGDVDADDLAEEVAGSLAHAADVRQTGSSPTSSVRKALGASPRTHTMSLSIPRNGDLNDLLVADTRPHDAAARCEALPLALCGGDSVFPGVDRKG